jgi:predicted glutamine amidotransferase
MARLFGVLGNRGELTERLLAQEAEALRVYGTANLGWGLGFVQGGELLMRRKPAEDSSELYPHLLARDLKSDFLLGHVRRATVGSLKPENTHPFRYRSLMFAQTGTVARFGEIRESLLGSIPEFLRSGIRGETDSEIVFNLVLSFLHDLGALSEVEPRTEIDSLKKAVRSTLALLEAKAQEVGGVAAPLNMMFGNGDWILAVTQAAPMAIRLVSGKHDADALIGDDANLRRRIPELAQMHMALVASDFGPIAPQSSPPDRIHPQVDGVPALPWKSIPQSSFVLLGRGREPAIESI